MFREKINFFILDIRHLSTHDATSRQFFFDSFIDDLKAFRIAFTSLNRGIDLIWEASRKNWKSKNNER